MKIKIQKNYSPIEEFIDSLINKQMVISFNSISDSQTSWHWLCGGKALELIFSQNAYHKGDRIYRLIMSLLCISQISINGFHIYVKYSISESIIPASILNASSLEGMKHIERNIYFMHPCIAIVEKENHNNNFYEKLIDWKNENQYLGDYFRHNCKFYQTRKKVKIAGLVFSSAVIHLSYMTIYKNEQLFRRQCYQKTNEIVSKLRSPYDKVKAIYYFVTRNISYDSSFTKHSAYHALIERTAVCEGISLLLFSMLKHTDIPVRVIFGKGNNVKHSWNIVCLNNEWYNLDVTWDLGKPEIRWDYFLRGNKNFPYHIVDAKLSEELLRDRIAIADHNYCK